MNRILFGLLLAISVSIGCAPTTIFYWGDYSETLYDFKKNPSDKTVKAHKESLVKIIAEAPTKHLKVPPGVNAEYGYLLLKEGKETEGMQYLDKEVSLFPESAILIERLKDEFARGKK